jgi:hypothetical protein
MLFSSITMLCGNEKFRVTAVTQGQSGTVQWTDNGLDWNESKTGDVYDGLTGIALPQGSSLTLSLKGKNKVLKGPLNTLIKDAVSEDSMATSVMSKLHTMLFAKSDVKEASSRSIDGTVHHAFFYGDFPEITSSETIATVSLFQTGFYDPLLVDEVNADKYDFTDYDLSEISSSSSSEPFHIEVTLAESGKKHTINISFISDSEYAVISEYSSFDTVSDWLFSTPDHVNKKRLKSFIGRFAINL